MTESDLIEKYTEEEREKVFLEMPEPDRWRVIFSMLAYLRKEIPIIKKQQIEFQSELRSVRERREAKELDTNEKIADFFSKRFDGWVWFRDRVMPQIITLIVLAVLYMTFGAKP